MMIRPTFTVKSFVDSNSLLNNIREEFDLLRKELDKELGAMSSRFANELRMRFISRIRKERTGRLAASIKPVYQLADGIHSFGVRFDTAIAPYSKARFKTDEFESGTLRISSRDKNLTIPFPGGPADQDTPKKASDFFNKLHYIPSRRGYILAEMSRYGDGRRFTPVFTLIKMVTQKKYDVVSDIRDVKNRSRVEAIRIADKVITKIIGGK